MVDDVAVEVVEVVNGEENDVMLEVADSMEVETDSEEEVDVLAVLSVD